MPLTAAQMTAFFEQDAQMGIPHATVMQLQQEGITIVNDLINFDKDTVEQIAANLRLPAGRVPDPNPNAAPGATIPAPPFVFGAKSQKQLVTAAHLLQNYEEVGRATTPGNIQWPTNMKKFATQWKALEDKKNVDGPEVPKNHEGSACDQSFWGLFPPYDRC
jgi:hypothetical protein